MSLRDYIESFYAIVSAIWFGKSWLKLLQTYDIPVKI